MRGRVGPGNLPTVVAAYMYMLLLTGNQFVTYTATVCLFWNTFLAEKEVYHLQYRPLNVAILGRRQSPDWDPPKPPSI
jgi:hypothetical protein